MKIARVSGIKKKFLISYVKEGTKRVLYLTSHNGRVTLTTEERLAFFFEEREGPGSAIEYLEKFKQSNPEICRNPLEYKILEAYL